MDAENTSSFHSLAADNPSSLRPYATTTAAAAAATTTTFTISALPAHSTFPSPTSKKSQLLLSFYEKKTRNTWFSKSEEEVCWEQWTITVSAEPPPRNEHDRARLDCAAEAQLQHVLMQIVEFAGGIRRISRRLRPRMGIRFRTQSRCRVRRRRVGGRCLKRYWLSSM
ncbi:hypothetical protein BZA70DRAFT_97248 [Myxozyma melibiosi]|uniref:Autophagy-related protein 101 n=1 Tax=Myxozyma melibiosi TaxID=54550 RepID=A0ABR1EYG6_9ASCO